MKHGCKRILIVALLVTETTRAFAQAPEPPSVTAPVPVDAAPEVTPDEASGLIEPRDPAETISHKVARGFLFPVRAVWFVVWAPVRLVAWAYDRYAIQSRVKSFFFSEDGKIGLFPVVVYKSGFGLGGGLRFVMRDLFADKARLKLEANYGGEVVQSYKARYKSGLLLGKQAEFDVMVGFETAPRSRFFGIGNRERVVAAPAMLIDPLRDDTAVDTRFYYDAFVSEGALGFDLPGPLSARVSGGTLIREFDKDIDDDEVTTTTVYDETKLVGFVDGLSSVFADAELILDTLWQPRFYISRALPSTGWYASLRGGYVRGFDKDPSRFARWSADVRRYINVYADDRIVMLRALYQGVSGDIEHIPFLDLPALGGSNLLRGYPQDRFRDRQAGLVSAEYEWSVDRSVAAFVFMDAGRVWRNQDDFSAGDFRVGFGGGLQLHSQRNFLARIMLAGSADGDVFFQFSFNPLFANRRGEQP
ncbi:MAG: BamA/TamA family outer membrane protein [Kofleriaceae bacterium]